MKRRYLSEVLPYRETYVATRKKLNSFSKRIFGRYNQNETSSYVEDPLQDYTLIFPIVSY